MARRRRAWRTEGWIVLAGVTASFAVLAGCGDGRSNPGQVTGTTSGTTTSSTLSVGGGGSGEGGDGGSGGNGGDGGSSVPVGGGTVGPSCDSPPALPAKTAACPVLKDGTNTVAFGDGLERDVELRFSPEQAGKLDGPVVVVWHGDEQDAKSAIDEDLGKDVVAAIVAQGGLVVSPTSDPNAGAGAYPWWLMLDSATAPDDDLVLMDQVIACATDQLVVDPCRVHTVGFSEGAMHVTQVGMRRSGYIASVVVHSGAKVGDPPEQDGDNAYAAMVLYGGGTDADGFQFGTEAPKYADELVSPGQDKFKVEHFTILCNHNTGHVVDKSARASTWRFLFDHRYGTDPSPYANDGLPESFPPYCKVHTP